MAEPDTSSRRARALAAQAWAEAVSSGDLEAMTSVLLKAGPLGRILRENPELSTAAEPRVRAALAQRGGGPRVALKAAAWIVAARA